MENTKPVEVFFSYSHRDETLRDELGKHLTILKREGVIDAWHDRKITAGSEWEGQIDEHIISADIILLLLSADFLVSDYCCDVEMTRAMERHEAGEARVIPIILRDCDWSGPLFGKLQAVPKDAKPVTSWLNRDEAFADVARGIRKAVAQLAGEPDETTPTPRRGRRRRKAIWNVPHRQNLNFTGREKLLAELHKSLSSGTPAALTQAIAGLGGVGKTQLALEYAYRHTDDYEAILWVRSEEPAQLAGDYAALAEGLNLPEKDATEQEQTIAAVRSWLEANSEWLLIFDDVPKPKSLDGYLPRPQTGAIVITSRHGAWRGTAEPLEVKVLPRRESTAFLKRRTGREDDGDALAEALGDLPLALEQAGAYAEENGISFGEYLAIFKKHQKDILRRRVTTSDYDTSVATTWEVSFSKLRPEAADLLNLCAFLAPDDIPLDLIAEGAEFLPERLARAVSAKKSFAECVGELARYSLVTRGKDTISIHRIVQAVVGDRLTPQARKRFCQMAVRSVNAQFPRNITTDPKVWPVCRRLLPHALAAAGHTEPDQVALEEAGRLLNHVGVYLEERAEFGQAKAIIEWALEIDEKACGKDHPSVAIRVNNLGSVLHDMGDLEGAKKCFERALKLGEDSFGPYHPTVAIRVNNLGLVLKDLGDLAGAKKCCDRALKIDQKAYGKDHPHVGSVVNNLGGVLRALGDSAGAKKCFERALKIDEKAYGKNHPEVATDVNNLGNVLHDLGDMPGAKKCYERALKIDEKAYGKDHPRVATDVNNLGSVLYQLGDLAGAKKCVERALKIDEKAYGKDHPAVATDVNNLGSVLKNLGDLAGAERCFDQALGIRLNFLGEDHPHTQLVRENLARLKEPGRKAGKAARRKPRKS